MSYPQSASPMYVAIATAGRPTLLSKTLESVIQARKPKCFREIIVVENGQKTGAEQVVKSNINDRTVRYVHFQKANKSAALNYLLGNVGEGLIVFTDDDVRVEPDWLDAYSEAAAEKLSGEFYGGPVYPDYEEKPPEWLKRFLPASVLGTSLACNESRIERPFCLGCNWAAFAKDLKNAGGFDERKGPGAVSGSTGQETDMQRRLLALGVRGRYLPAVPVWHYVPESRCSPKWVLQRQYRYGVDCGLSERSDVAILCGYPRWAVRRFLESAARFAASRFKRSTSDRFEAHFRLMEALGFLQGWKARQKLHSLAAR